jgi:RNA polymerase sigma-70 factor (ECF subfamily)
MTAIQDQPQQRGRPEPVEGPCERLDFADLVRTHQPGVWRYLRLLGADHNEADDLTQETFLAFARSEFVERCDRQTAAYLRVIARNQLLALRRKQNREVSTVELESAEVVWAAAAGADGNLTEYLDALRECLQQLEGRARRAVDMHYRDDAGREAIADELEMKPDGVKTLLRRTRQILRECIEHKINSTQ